MPRKKIGVIPLEMISFDFGGCHAGVRSVEAVFPNGVPITPRSYVKLVNAGVDASFPLLSLLSKHQYRDFSIDVLNIVFKHVLNELRYRYMSRDIIGPFDDVVHSETLIPESVLTYAIEIFATFKRLAVKEVNDLSSDNASYRADDVKWMADNMAVSSWLIGMAEYLSRNGHAGLYNLEILQHMAYAACRNEDYTYDPMLLRIGEAIVKHLDHKFREYNPVTDELV